MPSEGKQDILIFRTRLKPVMHSIWLVLVLSVLSSSVRAGTLGDLTYEITDGQVRITDCNEAAESELVIPAEIEGNRVTRIRYEAFRNCSSLTSITIPDSVTSIGQSAFSDCTSLTSIVIPEGVTSIGDYAFWRCSSLTSIVIPEGVTSIESSAFGRCSSLASITIPGSVTSIGSEAFRYCSSLTSIVIPESVTSIGNDAFAWCRSLTSIVIPEGVTSIGDYAFDDCSSLSSITIGDSVTSIGHYAFESCSSLTAITMPDSVTSIGSEAFSGCSSLSSITIGDGVTSIVVGAFDDCSSLTSIAVAPGNSTYKSLDGVLFSKSGKSLLHYPAAKSGRDYIIPEGVTMIGPGAFNDCSSLTSIVIPESVTTIRYRWAFSGCSSLTSITIPQRFHSQSMANILGIGHLWPDGFFLPSSADPTPKLYIRLPLQLILAGVQNTKVVIEATDSINGPWAEWRTVVVGEEGTTEVDLDEGAEKRFYRVRD